MTMLDKAFRDGKRLNRNAASAALTAASGGEMLRAASDVIAARLNIMAEGMANPMKADMAEMSSDEHGEGRGFLGIRRRPSPATWAISPPAMSQSAMDEIEPCPACCRGRSPRPPRPQAGAATAQYDYAVGWWGRAAGQMLTLNTELLKAQADALEAPFIPPP